VFVLHGPTMSFTVFR